MNTDIKYGTIEIEGSQYTVPQPVVDTFRKFLQSQRKNSIKNDYLNVDKFTDATDKVNKSGEWPPVEKLKEGRKTPFEWQTAEAFKNNKPKKTSAEKMKKAAILNTLGIL